MKTGNAVCVFDLGEFLPSYGETSVSFVLEKSGLTVGIEYDLATDGEGRKILHFDGVVSAATHVVPGIADTCVEYATLGDLLFCVVEFPAQT